MHCLACDPTIHVIMGYCQDCGRKCLAPSLPNDEIPIEDWVEFVNEWNGHDLDSPRLASFR